MTGHRVVMGDDPDGFTLTCLHPECDWTGSLIFARLGVDYEWCPLCPDDWFSEAGYHCHDEDVAS